MAWSYKAIGAVAHQDGSGSVTPTAPTFAAQDLLVISTGAFAGTRTLAVPSGWIDISPHINVTNSYYMFARVAQGGDTMPVLAWGSGSVANGVCASFSCPGLIDNTSIIIDGATGDKAATSTSISGLSSAHTAANSGTLVLFGGNKNKSATSNGSTVSQQDGNFTQIFSECVTGASQLAACLAYWIQTTPVATAGGANISGTADSAAGKAAVVFLSLPAATSTTSVGFVPQPGNPALSSPTNRLQFQGLEGFGVAPAIPAPISGIWASTSLFYAPMTTGLINVNKIGFVKGCGPSLAEPFNLNQFETLTTGGTSNPSSTTANIAGTFDGTSVFYGGAISTGTNLAGTWASSSTFYGSVTGVVAGTTGGVWSSSSLFYGNLGASGDMNGEWDSSSLLAMRGIGGSFQPLVPFTAVVDVRLGIGYQPWKVHPAGTSG